ncbi:SGNH/GDSL hydrolase family protein, partial [Clostridium sp.]|uniref:SGNH/GDSL hydrolase family protein n=1 Tax=Clostridium sp. TaxID=1506 RepID=UPI003F33577C
TLMENVGSLHTEIGTVVSESKELNIAISNSEAQRESNEAQRIDEHSNRMQVADVAVGKMQSDYEGLRKVIIDENVSANLQNQINKTNSDLEHKANEVDVRKKDTLMSMADMGQDVKEAMTGGSVAVVGNNTVVSTNIVDKEVKPRNTSFMVTSDNIFPYCKDVSNIGMQLNISNGTIYSASSYSVTNFIKVSSNKTYYKKLCGNTGGIADFATGQRICYYDSFYNFISGETIPSLTITTPSNCCFIRISDQKTDGVELRDKYLGENDIVWLPTSDYYEPLQKEKKQKASIYSLNLFDSSKYTKDTRFTNVMYGIYNDDSLLLQTTTGYFTSDYMECEEGEVIHIGWFSSGSFVYADASQKSFAFFDKDKKIMGRSLIDKSITVPKQARYFRFYSSESRRLYLQVIKGNLPTTNINAKYIKTPFIDDVRVAKYESVRDWWNKKWLTYGDSITAIGNIENPNDPSWQYYVNNYYEFSSHIGRGVGGSTFKFQNAVFWANSDGSYNSRPDGSNTQPAGTTEHNSCFCSFDRIKKMIGVNSDLIFIMGGTNDFGQNVPIGDTKFDSSILSDTVWQSDTTYREFAGDFKIDTFKGSIASTIMKIQAYSPNSIIVLGTQLSGQGVTGSNRVDMITNSLGLTPYDYAKAMKEVANEFSIPVIDVFSLTGINQFNRKKYITDSVHPYSENGKKAIARTIICGLKNVMPNII